MTFNCIFIGSFLYPNGYAATKRKQQFLDYIVSQGNNARVLITLKLAQGQELNDNHGVYNSIPYEVLGSNVKPNVLLPFTFTLFLLKTFYSLIVYRKNKSKNIIVAFGINLDTLLPLIFAKLIGYKIVFDIVEDFSSTSTELSLRRKIIFWLYRTFPKYFIKSLASGISVISNFLKNELSKKKRDIPVLLIPISASNLQFETVSKEKDEFNILYAGTYGEKEGLITLFKGVKKFSYLHHNTNLILTGNCPETIKKQLLVHFNDNEKLNFVGRLNEHDYYQALANADVLLITRNNSAFANAGFPFKLGEYLATGNPVITTKVSDIGLYLKNMESAFLINPDDPDELAEMLTFVYDNPEFAGTVGQKGRKVCEQYFNPVINSSAFYSLLKKC